MASVSRPRSQAISGREAKMAAAVGVLLAVLASHSAHAGTGHRTHAAAGMAIPGSPSGGYTPSSWAHAMLTTADLPHTRCNLAAVTSWERAEGGNWANTAKANPLNTTMPEPGSWVVNSDGVRAYPSWRTGLRATVATLRNGRYSGVLAALHAGHDAQAVADAVGSSPWGTGGFGASC